MFFSGEAPGVLVCSYTLTFHINISLYSPGTTGCAAPRCVAVFYIYHTEINMLLVGIGVRFCLRPCQQCVTVFHAVITTTIMSIKDTQKGLTTLDPGFSLPGCNLNLRSFDFYGWYQWYVARLLSMVFVTSISHTGCL